MHTSQPVIGPALIVVCVVMVAAAALVYRIATLGSVWIVPRAALRAVAQLAAVAGVLAAAMSRLWSSVLVLAVMLVVAAATAARRSQAQRGWWWLAGSLAVGLSSVLPLLLISGVVPLNGVAIVPMVGIVLGGTMTAVAVAARRALDTLGLRVGEVEAALSLGLSERDSRMEIIGRSATDALLPNLDQTRTVGVVTLPGAFVGVLLSTGSPMQAGAVQILILLALLLSQTCAGNNHRTDRPRHHDTRIRRSVPPAHGHTPSRTAQPARGPSTNVDLCPAARGNSHPNAGACAKRLRRSMSRPQ